MLCDLGRSSKFSRSVFCFALADVRDIIRALQRNQGYEFFSSVVHSGLLKGNMVSTLIKDLSIFQNLALFEYNLDPPMHHAPYLSQLIALAYNHISVTGFSSLQLSMCTTVEDKKVFFLFSFSPNVSQNHVSPIKTTCYP